MNQTFKITRKRTYAKRIPLTGNQKQYVRDNHRRMSPGEMASNLNVEIKRVCSFMYANHLYSSNDIHGSKMSVPKDVDQDGIFNVQAYENWIV